MKDEKPTKAEMMKRLYDERKAAGVYRRCFWLTDAELPKVKKYIKKLQDK